MKHGSGRFPPGKLTSSIVDVALITSLPWRSCDNVCESVDELESGQQPEKVFPLNYGPHFLDRCCSDERVLFTERLKQRAIETCRGIEVVLARLVESEKVIKALLGGLSFWQSLPLCQ